MAEKPENQKVDLIDIQTLKGAIRHPGTHISNSSYKQLKETDSLDKCLAKSQKPPETRFSEPLENIVQKLQSKIENLEKEIELLRTDNKQLSDENTYFSQQLVQFQSSYQSGHGTSYYETAQPQYIENLHASQTSDQQPIVSCNPNELFVNTYNTNPDSLSTYATGVSETKESILRRTANSSDRRVRLKFIGASYFWVLTNEYGVSFLVPRPDIDPLANAVSFDTFQCVFEVTGTIQIGRKLQLVHPAEVEQYGDEWEVTKTGEVYFY